MKRKIKVFKNKYNEPRAGWMTIAAILLIFAGQLIAGAVVPEGNEEVSIGIKILVTAIYSGITIGGGILLFRVVYRQPLSAIGLIRKNWIKWLLGGLLLGTLSMGMIVGALMLFGQIRILQIDVARLLSVKMLVEFISLGFTAFSEEYLLRGMIMTALKTTRNRWVVFCTPAVIFALVHLLNPGITIISFVNTLLGGLLFSYLFVKSGTLWFPTGFHIAWNFLQGDVLGMNVSGNAQAAAISTEMGDLSILTGGSYGIEGGILATAALILGFLVVKCVIITPKSSNCVAAVLRTR